jgi:hypothetical protein
MNAKLYNQVEIAFWDFVIFALSESRFIRRLTLWFYRMLTGKTMQTALLTAAVGFFSGLVLYIVAFNLLKG